MCMDGFMFGSCCVHDTADNMISEHQQTTSKRFPATTTTTTLPPIRRKTTYEPFSSVSYNKDYYQRPKRPPRSGE